MAKYKAKRGPVIGPINVKSVPKELWRKFVGSAKMEGMSAGQALEALIADYFAKQRDKQERETRHA